MTRMMLERKGYSVLPAATPGEAIDLAKTHADKIHLLMTDVVMPEMNGRDLAGKIISLYPEIRLLFMSGYTSNVIAHHGVLDDGVAFIQKPFSMADMTEKFVNCWIWPLIKVNIFERPNILFHLLLLDVFFRLTDCVFILLGKHGLWQLRILFFHGGRSHMTGIYQIFIIFLSFPGVHERFERFLTWSRMVCRSVAEKRE
jgi:CheY-like chemotaxis protein